MNEEKHTVFEFGGFQLDPVQQRLLHNGEPVALAHKVFETLVLLVQNPGRVMEKKELLQALWPDSFVEEGNLSQNIFLLRKLLGDDRNGHSFIHTIPRQGYKFIASVTQKEATTPAIDAAAADFWRQHSPFRSLRAFEPEDAWLFFGRDKEIDDLLVRLGRSPVLAMVGNSGSGKSSLLRAGLIPALRAGRFSGGSSGWLPADSWRIAVFRPSAAPFDYLAEVLPGQVAPELSVKEQAEFIADCRGKLRAGGDALRNAVSALALAAAEKLDKAKTGASGHARVLLVVDQFEEIFTLTGKQAIRDRYIDGLLAAARVDSAVSVHLVLTLRADFYGHCLEHPGLSRSLEANLYNVPRMTPEQMREAIEKRLQLAGGRAEPGLIDALLEDAGAEPGNLALLEHALGQLWERCGGAGCTFTNQAYSEIGRLRGALGRHADQVFQGLGEDEQKRLAQRIFLELVHLGEGAQDTRRRVAKAELLTLGEPAQVEKLVERLASSRLIATGREGGETFVEVSHEALIREWPALREWLAENREELALERRLLQSAEEWESLQRDSGALLQGARLAQGEEWLGRHADAPGLAREYVQASLEARAEAARKEREAQERELKQQKATARRFRWFSYVLVIFLMVAVGSASFAYHQQVLEKSRAMAAQAEELAPRDHGQALDMAIRSWQTAKTEEAHLAVAKTFPQLLFTLKHDDTVYRIVFSPDGQRILSAGQDHAARLWSAKDGSLLAVLNHDGSVQYIDFSADGERIVTASQDRTARVWNGRDGRLLVVLKGHTSTVWRAEFSPDGQRIVTASLDHTARVWNTADGRLLVTLTGHSDYVVSARFSPDGQRILTMSNDKTARVWNSVSGKLLTILHHLDMLSYGEFSRDGRRIITASYDGTARTWSLADGHLLITLQHQGPVVRAVFSPDGERIATAGYDGAARIWDGRSGQLLAMLRHEGPVTHVEFSIDGQRVATSSSDHTARIWNSDDGQLLAILEGHTRELYHATFSPSGEEVATGGADSTVRVWSLTAARSSKVLHHDSAVTSAAFSPDGQLIATASSDHTIGIWTAAGDLRFRLQGHTDRVWPALFSPNGQQILTASVDGTARIWNVYDGRPLSVLRGHIERVMDASFSPDGLRIITAGWDHTARVWASIDGRVLAVMQGHTDAVFRARFSPDGQQVVTASADHTARVWNSTDGHLLTTLHHSASVSDAAFSPDGAIVATASADGAARLWSTPEGRLLAILRGHANGLTTLTFSRDGQRIFTTSFDHTARVWNRAGDILAVLQGHTAAVYRPTFSSDGQRMATPSLDQTARVWSAADGHLIVALQGHSGSVFDVNFSPDGQRIITASEDQTARIWQILTLDDVERILSH